MGSSARILVLEDDSNMLELLCEALEEGGYEARGARAPEQALEMARKIPFHLIVSDIRMAGVTDGLGAIAAIKKIQPNARVVMITGYASSDAPRRAIQLQVDDYIHKPFRVPVLLDVVARVLSRRRGILAPFEGLRTLLGAPLKLLTESATRRLQRLTVLLEQEKQRVLQGFFLALRSRALSKSAALEIWDGLENLEAQGLRLSSDPKEESLQHLGSCYRQLYGRVCHYEKTGNVAGSAPRRVGQVGRNGFGVLVDQVQAGQVTLEDLIQVLWTRVQPEREAELEERLAPLYRGLFS